MQHTIYIDILFLLNFIVDGTVLASTALVTGLPIKKIRFTVSSLIGALYSTLIFFPSLNILNLILFKILISLIIVIIAFGNKSFIFIIKNLIVFYIITIIYGGGIYAFYSLTPNGSKMLLSNGIYYINLPLWSIILLIILYYFTIKTVIRINNGKILKNEIQEIIIETDKQKFKANALYDSGNSLYDPISLLPVVLAENKIFGNMFINDENRYTTCSSRLLELHQQYPNLKFRLIPYTDITGNKNNIIAFKPKSITLTKNSKTLSNVLIAITEFNLSNDNTYNALLHSDARRSL